MKRFLITVIFIAAYAGLAGATGLNSLEMFVKNVKSGRADFSQVVTSPAKEGQLPKVKTSTGQFEFARPNRFRFNYTKPFEQTIVADGQTLWLYDADLNQVTARKQSAVLGSTPAALIASAADLQALKADFLLADAPDANGLQWVTATPKSKDGQLQSVRVGFRVAGEAAAPTSTLEVLEILDSFGQRSVLTFKQFQSNPALPSTAFAFKPPVGADVIRQ
ncbi:MAG: outer membrane lipoprotein chaperone LolA [Rhodoferax sp.]|uniref:outer membrane lipoprotein chaperone LolA n=1 Tax=Rhodoferax sp. TaxID=50421 RepID=UPI00261A52FD|nr:outer membrane lipoprotein chaperone LolA [Rhodoferax sp.]MDD2878956.1 outer membrane lipoprotein chaperone LolA [Rhodoferax sp.]